MTTRKRQRGQRGRKPGDGILKELDASQSYLEKAFKLAHGRTSGQPAAEIVRAWGDIRRALLSPAIQKDKELSKHLRPWVRAQKARLADEAMTALLEGKAEWFEMIGAAIRSEAARNGKDAYPLHAAILALTWVPYVEGVVPDPDRPGEMAEARVYLTNMPVSPEPCYTLSELAKTLQEQRLRPADQSEVDWHRTVRRACEQIGFPLLPDKAGRPKKTK